MVHMGAALWQWILAGKRLPVDPGSTPCTCVCKKGYYILAYWGYILYYSSFHFLFHDYYNMPQGLEFRVEVRWVKVF